MFKQQKQQQQQRLMYRNVVEDENDTSVSFDFDWRYSNLHLNSSAFNTSTPLSTSKSTSSIASSTFSSDSPFSSLIASTAIADLQQKQQQQHQHQQHQHQQKQNLNVEQQHQYHSYEQFAVGSGGDIGAVGIVDDASTTTTSCSWNIFSQTNIPLKLNVIQQQLQEQQQQQQQQEQEQLHLINQQEQLQKQKKLLIKQQQQLLFAKQQQQQQQQQHEKLVKAAAVVAAAAAAARQSNAASHNFYNQQNEFSKALQMLANYSEQLNKTPEQTPPMSPVEAAMKDFELNGYHCDDILFNEQSNIGSGIGRADRSFNANGLLLKANHMNNNANIMSNNNANIMSNNNANIMSNNINNYNSNNNCFNGLILNKNNNNNNNNNINNNNDNMNHLQPTATSTTANVAIEEYNKNSIQNAQFNDLWNCKQLVLSTPQNNNIINNNINSNINNNQNHQNNQNNQNNKVTKRFNTKNDKHSPAKHCVFCENNNEPKPVVKSHAVRDMQGRVLCPRLRTYICPICKESGDNAHTIKYCPRKPIITMEDSVRAESLRLAMNNYLTQINQQMKILN